MRNVHCRTWSMARKLNIMENEKHTQQELDYGEKNTQKRGKWEMHTVVPGVRRENRKSWKMRNKNCRM